MQDISLLENNQTPAFKADGTLPVLDALYGGRNTRISLHSILSETLADGCDEWNPTNFILTYINATATLRLSEQGFREVVPSQCRML